ncbi:hypothetical protein SISNIDRAFT_492040 [Sistotremastrum niveocremeum HHB9708]|uniref:Integrase catalytic domain-containing protein n=1 Tax=Sistotremastrum niveocremeum HHB9708 TaxID=1314777 RepID=A0A164M4D2_9AGAM|nr:hypothetical protein SISNIDRAFT_492040 [Sistotremastrum niveocremeum HHB9708]
MSTHNRNPTGKNGGKPIPPEELMRPLFHKYLVETRSTNPLLLTRLRKHFPASEWGLSISTIRKYRDKWGFPSAKKQGHTIASIDAAVKDNALRLSRQGRRGLKDSLRRDYGIDASEKVIIARYQRIYDPSGVARRRRHIFAESRPYESSAVHECWSFDQHDKWRRFHLYLHVGIEVFSGRIQWLKIWWTNRNPRLVCGWYLDVVEELGGMPLITQSDRGSENNGIANAQTFMRHKLDEELGETLQHRWRGKNRNIKPEIFWSGLRRWWEPDFENMLEEGFTNHWYDPTLPLHRFTFSFFYVFIPWLQFELDRQRSRLNMSKRQGKPEKLLPNDEPDIICEFPEDYGVISELQPVGKSLIRRARSRFAPLDHSVNQLVPPEFGRWADECYRRIGQPAVSITTGWEVYNDLLRQILTWVEPNPQEDKGV